jgi:hypothetical protein
MTGARLGDFARARPAGLFLISLWGYFLMGFPCPVAHEILCPRRLDAFMLSLESARFFHP